MAFIRRRAKADDVPVSSFSDIAFLLIIFFILVTSLEQFAGFKAALPAGEQSTQEAEEEMPTVKMHDGRITMNEDTVTIEQLHERLKAMNLAERETDEERIVIIEATGRVEYQVYFEVMAAISHAGGVIAIIKEGD